MKRLLLAITVLSLSSVISTQAASGGPDAYGYTWRDSNDPNGPVYNWLAIETNPDAVDVKPLSDDNFLGPYNMTFNFHYYWYDVSSFYIGSNGYISFNPGQLSHPFPQIPSVALPQDFIAPMLCDLNFETPNIATKCFYLVTPNQDSLIISWLNVPFFDPASPGYSGLNSFQMILCKSDSSITFQYKDQQGAYNGATTQFMTIGIENVSGSVGLMHSADTYPQTAYAIKFYYPPTTTYQATDVSVSYNDNIDTGGLFLSKNGSSYGMTTQIKNTGNQPTGAFNVFTRVVNSGNTIQAQDNLNALPLQPAQTQVLTASTSFTPTAVGKYRFITDTQLGGDIVPTNNSKVQELVVVDTTFAEIRLSFDDGTNDGIGLSWNGGEGGAAIYFIPPFYPCKITKTHFYIVDNPNFVDFSAHVYDDNGIAGNAGTELDSSYLFSSSMLTNSWNDIPVTTPITITSGGFYVAWKMQGEGVLLGQDLSVPQSNRTYEILSNTLSIYRYRETEDVMINVTIEKTGVGVDENTTQGLINIYPHPAADILYVETTLPVSLYDISGKAIAINTATDSQNRTVVNTSTLANGMYILQVGSTKRQKVIIAH